MRAFRDKQANRIILTRPAVEAGERLGFLPGDLQSKVDPYLRPLYDALFDLLGSETYQKYMERGNIEIAPLAYMRGRTLDDSFIILDEAQNTSREQMKMFLTRLGFGSKMVITGDATQIDLPDGKESGLREAMRVLRDIDGIGICELTDADVVRHVMVQKIVQAYAAYEEQRNLKRENNNNYHAPKNQDKNKINQTNQANQANQIQKREKQDKQEKSDKRDKIKTREKGDRKYNKNYNKKYKNNNKNYKSGNRRKSGRKKYKY